MKIQALLVLMLLALPVAAYSDASPHAFNLSSQEGRGVLSAEAGGALKSNVRPVVASESQPELIVNSLSDNQVANLALLGRVWGFLKYYHPAAISGAVPWDDELFKEIPSILDATDHVHATEELARWVDGLGALPGCSSCAKDAGHSELTASVSWLSDKSLLGARLSHALVHIYARRPIGEQHYVKLANQAKNAIFVHENNYQDAAFPNFDLQILALFRYWNVIEYWYPYRKKLDADWPKILSESIRPVALANSKIEYEKSLLTLMSSIEDSHAAFNNSLLAARPPQGTCRLPLFLESVDQQFVVTGVFTHSEGDFSARPGDILTDMGGQPVKNLIKRFAPLYPASNSDAKMRDLAARIGVGSCEPVPVDLVRDGHVLSGSISRIPSSRIPAMDFYRHDMGDVTFVRVGHDVAYLNLANAKADDIDTYIKSSLLTKGLIIDARNYPSEFLAYKLGSHLISKETGFAKITYPNLSNPGAFLWGPTMSIEPKEPFYPGKVVILVDSTTQSQAEFTVLALRAGPHVKVIGSQTAGADGNISWIDLPYGVHSAFSGLGVFDINGDSTQRVGLKLDVVVHPTISSIREGRDEVLDQALHIILGPNATASSISEMVRSAFHHVESQTKCL